MRKVAIDALLIYGHMLIGNDAPFNFYFQRRIGEGGAILVGGTIGLTKLPGTRVVEFIEYVMSKRNLKLLEGL